MNKVIYTINDGGQVMPHVYVIILNYKKWMDVTECLETLLRSGYDNFTTIIIDNDSQNNSLEHLIKWTQEKTAFSKRISFFSKDILEKPLACKYFKSSEWRNDINPSVLPGLLFIQNDSNKGFAGGINTMLQWLLKEDAYVWLLNPDMLVEESTLTELVKCAAELPRKSIVGSVVKLYEQPHKIHFYAGGMINYNSATVELLTDKKKLSQLDYISGGCLFTHLQNFAALGLLPEDYFLYWEETDLCFQAKKKGYQLCLCDTAICYDKVSTSIGKNFLSDFYYTRNGLLFLSKYKKGKVPFALFFIFFRVFKRILTGEFARAKGMFAGMRSFLNRDEHANK